MQDWKMRETTLYGTPCIPHVCSVLQSFCAHAVSHNVGALAVPEDGMADSDAEDDDEVHNDSDSDQPQSAVNEPQ